MTFTNSLLSNCGSSGMVKFPCLRVEAVGIEPTGVSFADPASDHAAPINGASQ